MSLSLYLDTCCYGRPQDYQGDLRVAAETAVIKKIVSERHISGHSIVGSLVVTSELRRNSDIEKMVSDMEFYLDAVDREIDLTEDDEPRAQLFQAAGLKKMDSYHLVAAERAGVNVLLTVDDDFAEISTKKN